MMLRADKLDVAPMNNAYGTVVNLMNPGHVGGVFIAGKVENGAGRWLESTRRASSVRRPLRAKGCFAAEISRWVVAG